MHKLARQIRFAVNPFADSAEMGANSYCAKPTGEGLALFFALWVELTGPVDADTGFVVNVSDIDRIVRDKAVGIFEEFVKHKFGQKEQTPLETRRQRRLTADKSGLSLTGQVSFEQIGQLLSKVWQTIEKEFLPARIDNLTVELMPTRKLGIKERQGDMLYISEKFEFAASHILWNDKFSDDENYKIFGKCANRSGHGHNYIVEVTIKKPAKSKTLKAGDFENIVEKGFIRLVDHKNLSADVEYFKKVNPTVENIAEFAFKSLADKLKPLELDCVTVWENDRTFCSFRAE